MDVASSRSPFERFTNNSADTLDHLETERPHAPSCERSRHLVGHRASVYLKGAEQKVLRVSCISPKPGSPADC